MRGLAATAAAVYDDGAAAAGSDLQGARSKGARSKVSLKMEREAGKVLTPGLKVINMLVSSRLTI